MQRCEFDILDSTNDEARRLLAAGKIDEVAVISARGQNAGRGTRGRSWVSPAGAGLYLSYVCQNRKMPDASEALPLTNAYTKAAGVVCVDAVREVAGVNLRIKPVNDLIWQGRKVGGILTEAFVVGDRLSALIIGIGINVYQAERPISDGVMPAGCLAEAVGPRGLEANIIPSLQSAIVVHLADRISPPQLALVDSEWRKRLIESELE